MALAIERAELGVTQAEAHVLGALARKGPCSIGELHRSFGHKRSTLTAVLDRLERRGLAGREPKPGDRRSFMVVLTPAGEEAGVRVAKALDGIEARVRQRATERDLAGFRKVLAAIEEEEK